MNSPLFRILMLGPNLNATSGISNVVNNWLEVGLDKRVDLKYIPTLKHFVPGRLFRKFFEALQAYLILLNLDRNAVDIIHIHFSTGMSFYRKYIISKIAMLKGFKIVIHLHSSSFHEYYENSGKLRKKLIHIFFNQSDLVFVLSEHWKEYCAQFCTKSKLKVLNNGASTTKFFRRRKTERFVINIACMGRLGKRKGTYDLIEAFERLCLEHSNLKLVLGGDGDVERVRKIVRDKQLEDRIEVPGWVSGNKKIEIFQKADIYVLPSYNEGMPGSVLEAMAVGTAIISTSVGGIPEIVQNHINGYLIRPGDIEALYSRLKTLVSNSPLRNRMATESRRIIQEKFEITLIVDQLLSHYKDILRKEIHRGSF